jgi:pimeloyl-ACP methyl ester carboxylesterase
MDYHNSSDARTVRLAVTRYQVSGLARVSSSPSPPSLDLRSLPSAGTKSPRTIIVEPGGPGGSGTFKAWSSAEEVSRRFSDGQFDVLGWDPRGVNMSLPSVSCFPHNAQRDRWALATQAYRETTADPTRQLRMLDAMNNASFAACRERIGDFGRLVNTAVVARDLDEIRNALAEEEVTGYFISYGTGIAQTYANMFPQRVGRMVLDGNEYVRDHWLLGGFGYTALDNVTDAWHDGFLGECLHAGPEACALARLAQGEDGHDALAGLQKRVERMVRSLIDHPLPAYTVKNGPSLITYSSLVAAIYQALYRPRGWADTAQMLYELYQGNTTLAALALEKQWEFDPFTPATPGKLSDENDLANLVICADSFDAPSQPLTWWADLWSNMTAQSWIAGNSRFQNVFPCRHFNTHWRMNPKDVYRGDLNTTLKNPLLLISETYDPATPLRNGRRLAEEMEGNARLVVHHGYGHSSQWDVSACTERIGRAYLLAGEVPDERVTNCWPDRKPFVGDG